MSGNDKLITVPVNTLNKMKNNNAFEFLHGLEIFLNSCVPEPGDMAEKIMNIVKQSKENEDVHKRFPEGALLNEYVTPNIHRYLTEKTGLTQEQACKALLSESFRNLSGIASASPARLEAHPFQKIVGAKAKDIMATWRGETKTQPITRSCPDIALRKPSPHTVLFEGKYFPEGGESVAETELIKDLYQAFFYLGLARLPETKTHPAWEYNYSCLIAYDASKKSSLKRSWLALDSSVKKAFWNGANIYVMILSGS